jgi:hypothetical protein
MTRQERRQHVARRPSDVDHGADTGEVVRLGNGRRLRSVEANHRLAEVCRRFGPLRQVVEEGRAPHVIECRLPGLERIPDLLPRAPERRAAEGE